jgi:hypothetical protein
VAVEIHVGRMGVTSFGASDGLAHDAVNGQGTAPCPVTAMAEWTIS